MLKHDIKKVQKLSGRHEDFLPEKIIQSIAKAAVKVGTDDQKLTMSLGNKVIETLLEKYPDGELIKTTEIGDLVEKILIQNGQTVIAQEFIRHRENKRHYYQNKNTLGITDDIGLTYNTLYILKRRYLKRDEKGKIIETPVGMIERVAKFLSSVEKTKKQRIYWNKKFYEIMIGFEFLPGTRPLANAGKKYPQLGNCFVWPMDDNIDKIFEILYKSTLIKKHGGGCGYNFSILRPEGDVVGGIPELAAGPVKIIQMFDLMTSLFKQEGQYESGNMAVLNADHPDIFKFISAKQNDGHLSKTNLSVGITDEFMNAVLEDRDWSLVNPRNKEIVSTVKAKSIFQLMAQMAWQTGDPGILNLSAINKGTRLGNPLYKKRGPILCTNVCGEIPQYPYESCNLGYVNFTKFVRGGKFDYKRLAEVVEIAVRLMDNIISASWFPVEEVSREVKNHRRIGIGCVGWAETLAMMNIAYDSQEALELAERVTKYMYKSAFKASCDLASEKGPFPYVNDSIWAKDKSKPRNVALLTFPPSSGNAVICETSFGIEPYFALAYEQNVLDGMKFRNLVPYFVQRLKEEGIYSESLVEEIISNHGSIQGINAIPPAIRRIFKVAHDINWKDHIRMQAAFQRWTDNAITKTINMPSDATPKDVEEAYILAWKLGCKGLTIYRDKSKNNQVFEFGGNKSTITAKCPECGGEMEKKAKCYKCKSCSFSSCEV